MNGCLSPIYYYASQILPHYIAKIRLFLILILQQAQTYRGGYLHFTMNKHNNVQAVFFIFKFIFIVFQVYFYSFNKKQSKQGKSISYNYSVEPTITFSVWDGTW